MTSETNQSSSDQEVWRLCQKHGMGLKVGETKDKEAIWAWLPKDRDTVSLNISEKEGDVSYTKYHKRLYQRFQANSKQSVHDAMQNVAELIKKEIARSKDQILIDIQAFYEGHLTFNSDAETFLRILKQQQSLEDVQRLGEELILKSEDLRGREASIMHHIRCFQALPDPSGPFDDAKYILAEAARDHITALEDICANIHQTLGRYPEESDEKVQDD